MANGKSRVMDYQLSVRPDDSDAGINALQLKVPSREIALHPVREAPDESEACLKTTALYYAVERIAALEAECNDRRQKLNEGRAMYERVIEHCQDADLQASQVGMRLRQYQDGNTAMAVHMKELSGALHRLSTYLDDCDENDYRHAQALVSSGPTLSLGQRDAHPDDLAVERFAGAMKAKLAAARAKGRSGWDDPGACSAECLAELLVGHLGKRNTGNLEDIANLAMMLHQRGDDPGVVADALARLIAGTQAKDDGADEFRP